MRRNVRRAILGASAVLALAVAGCGYTFAGSTSRLPEDVKTVSLGPIANRTREVGLEKLMLEAMEDEITIRGRLDVVPQGEGDAILSGTLTHYETRPVAFNSRDEALQYQAVLTLDLELRRRSDSRLLWQTRGYRAVEDYSAVPGVVVTSSSSFQRQTLNPDDLNLFTDIQLSEGQRREANERLLEELSRETYNQMMEDF